MNDNHKTAGTSTPTTYYTKRDPFTALQFDPGNIAGMAAFLKYTHQLVFSITNNAATNYFLGSHGGSPSNRIWIQPGDYVTIKAGSLSYVGAKKSTWMEEDTIPEQGGLIETRPVMVPHSKINMEYCGGTDAVDVYDRHGNFETCILNRERCYLTRKGCLYVRTDDDTFKYSHKLTVG
jgi:hypothetical protein